MKLDDRSVLLPLFLAAGLAFWSVRGAGNPPPPDTDKSGRPTTYRSPVALALSKTGDRLLTANQSSGSVSLIDVKSGKVLDEIRTGDRPSGVAFTSDGKHAVVTHWFGYDVGFIDVINDKLVLNGRVEVGPEPRGIAVAPDDKKAYVAVGVSNEVVRINLATKSADGRVTVGREPRGLAITPDGSKLVVGNSRDKSMSILELSNFKVVRTIKMQGDNLRQVAIDPTGKQAYTVNMFNRGFPTTRGNIDVGWVLGQRLTRITIDGTEPFETLTLDPKGMAAADVHGVALSSDSRLVAVSSGGTHEVFLFRLEGDELPWRSMGSRDLMSTSLVNDRKLFRRVPTGGRPTELAFSPDNKTIYAANFLSDSVQFINAETGKVDTVVDLGGPKEPTLARRGEILFHDATRSFNQWYSCATCHSDGHTNGADFDTMNDGWHDYSATHTRSRKKVPTLRRTVHTKPWTWHGWQKSIEDATTESFTKSMQGTRPTADEVKAVVAYLNTLDFPRNPYRNSDGSLTEQAKRGEKVFQSAKAACSTCHSGPEFTDGKIHEVGLEESDDYFKGFNPPSLRGVYDKDPFLHDGRSADLKSTLSGPHNPEKLGGDTLTPSELDDLIAYLKSL